jgi:hypothetical protein
VAGTARAYVAREHSLECPEQQQVLDVARWAGDRRLDVVACDKTIRVRPVADLGDCTPPRSFVSHDAAFADLVAPDFELRLHEADDRLPTRRALAT